MLLLSGVLLLCGAVIALAWAYEVNRREPKPRWARVEMIWETLLATVIGVGMVGILLALKYAVRPAPLVPADLVGALTVIAATTALVWYLLRPLRASRRTAAAGRATANRPEEIGQQAEGPGDEGPAARPILRGTSSVPARRTAA